MSKADIAKELLCLVGYALGVGVVIASWGGLPETVPIHFGLLGKPDGWAPKAAAAFLPVIATFLYLTLTVGQYFGRPNVPWRITPANRDRIYALTKNLIWWLKLQTTWMVAYLQYMVVQVAMKRADGLGVGFAPMFLGMVFFTLALYFYIGHRAARAS
jgi:uncharacterized membrane protein